MTTMPSTSSTPPKTNSADSIVSTRDVGGAMGLVSLHPQTSVVNIRRYRWS